MLVPGVTFEVYYEGRNISKDVSASLINIEYSDNTTGKADEVELTFDNTLRLWSNTWYPRKKDVISVRIGVAGQFLDCGNFEIDQTRQSGPPRNFIIQGIASGIKSGLRTKNFKAHEGKSLKQIAQATCDAHKLTLDQGTHVVTKQHNVESDLAVLASVRENLSNYIEPDTEQDAQIKALLDAGPRIGNVARSLESKNFNTQAEQLREGFRWTSRHISIYGIKYYINRVLTIETFLQQFTGKKEKFIVNNDLSSIIITRKTQANETDLAFLARVSREYGFAFNIKGSTMIFYMLSTLENRPHSITFKESDLNKYEVTTKTSGTYKSARLKHHDPNTQEVVTASVSYGGTRNTDGEEEAEETADDTLEIRTRAENTQQAEAKTQAALDDSNKKACTVSFEVPFDRGGFYCCSGNNVKLIDLGEDSGIFHIQTAKYTLSKSSGNTVSCEGYRVGFVGKNEKKLK